MSDAILISGGVDSVALAFWKRPAIGITINYGQACAEAEFRASRQVCSELGMQHETITVDCSALGSGDLLGSDPISLAPVPEWWPFRNQLLVTLAAMRAVAMDVNRLMIGAVKTDASHADGSQEFFRRINDVVSFQEGNIQVVTPAIHMTSVELLSASGIDLSLLAWVHSCHRANFACGTCRGCNKHRAVMLEFCNAPY